MIAAELNIHGSWFTTHDSRLTTYGLILLLLIFHFICTMRCFSWFLPMRMAHASNEKPIHHDARTRAHSSFSAFCPSQSFSLSIFMIPQIKYDASTLSIRSFSVSRVSLRANHRSNWGNQCRDRYRFYVNVLQWEAGTMLKKPSRRKISWYLLACLNF